MQIVSCQLPAASLQQEERPACSVVRRVSAAALIALICTTGGAISPSAQSSQPPFTSDHPLPGEAMYPARSTDAWQHTLKVVMAAGFRLEKNDKARQVLVTHWRQYDAQVFPPIADLQLPATDTPLRVQLHVAVAPEREPARVVFGSILESERRTAGRTLTALSYGHPTLDAWFFKALDSAMAVPHYPMPGTWASRSALAAKLMPAGVTDKCVAGESNAQKTTVKPPVAISKVEPVFPSEGHQSGDRTIRIDTVLTEHGTVTTAMIADTVPQFPHYAASARAAGRLWRYRPAMMGECPVVVFLTVTVNYTVR